MRMAKELVTDLVSRSKTRSLTERCRTVVLEDVLLEAVVGSDVDSVVLKLEVVDSMEYRLNERSKQKKQLRQRQARIARKMELESRWLANWRQEELDRLATSQHSAKPVENSKASEESSNQKNSVMFLIVFTLSK